MNSTNKNQLKIKIQLLATDWLTFNLVFWSCYFFHIWPFYRTGMQFSLSIIVANIAYLAAQQMVEITLHHRHSRPETVLRNTSCFFILFNAAFLGMLHENVPGPFRSLFIGVLLFLVIAIERLILQKSIQRRSQKSSNRIPVVIIGTAGTTQQVADVLCSPEQGFNLLGFFSNTESSRIFNKNTNEDIPRLGRRRDFLSYIESHHVAEVFISMRKDEMVGLQDLIHACDKHLIRVFFIPNIDFHGVHKTQLYDLGDTYVLAQCNEPLQRLRNRFIKRTFDIIVSGLFLCTLFIPILLIVAIVSKITMPGPLFFRQKRTGYNGRDFYCLKFRSMRVNKDSDKVQATKDDPRITKWGAFMRHTNIDELPQFINVFIGDMSLVGPRPHMLAHTEYYSKYISEYMIRHFIRPGITGWAQTHGERGETRTVHDMERRVEKDIWYLEHWSFWLDIGILLKTVFDTLHGDKKAF